MFQQFSYKSNKSQIKFVLIVVNKQTNYCDAAAVAYIEIKAADYLVNIHVVDLNNIDN